MLGFFFLKLTPFAAGESRVFLEIGFPKIFILAMALSLGMVGLAINKLSPHAHLQFWVRKELYLSAKIHFFKTGGDQVVSDFGFDRKLQRNQDPSLPVPASYSVIW